MSATAGAYSNELEQQFARLPGFLQDALRWPYTEMDKGLKAVAGEPQELLAAGGKYSQVGQQIVQLAGEMASDRARLVNGKWEGQAYDAFTATMTRVEGQIRSLGQLTGEVKGVLADCAQACTEGANAIVQIVGALISFLLTSVVVNGILALFTFGASLAAEVAEALAAAATTLARIAAVSEKVAAVLTKIAEILEKIAEFMREIETALTQLAEDYNKWKLLSKDAPKRLATAWGARTALHGATGVNIPGGGGELGHAGKSLLGGYQDVTQAQQTAGSDTANP